MTEEWPAHGYVVDSRQGLPGHGPGDVATRKSRRAALTVMESLIRAARRCMSTITRTRASMCWTGG